MKLAQIAVLNEDGTMFWSGSLRTFIRDNKEHSLVASLRYAMSGDRPEVVRIGGGAAPLFFVSIVN